MKSFLKIAVFLSFSALVSSQCTPTAANECTNEVYDCFNNGNTQNQTCACVGAYGTCLNAVSCYVNATSICLQYGCTLQQCSGIPQNASCSAASATACADHVARCVTKAGSDLDAICVCYGGYAGCLTDTGCDASSVITACESAGCASQLCSGNSTQNNTVCSVASVICNDDLTTCFSNAGSNSDAWCACIGESAVCLTDAGCDASSVIDGCESIGCSAQICNGESPQNYTCPTSAASACVSEASDCISSAGSNQNLTCECYGDFATCFDDAGCPDSGIINACLSNGCTAQQCGGNSPPNDCDADAALTCGEQVFACLDSNSNSNCDCFGSYIVCLDDAGCYTAGAEASCIAEGCSASECDGPFGQIHKQVVLDKIASFYLDRE